MSRLASPRPTLLNQLPRFTLVAARPRIAPSVDARQENRVLRRGSFWLATGNFVNAACSWGRLAILARLGNAEMIGQLALALAVCGPIGELADLGLSGALVSDARRQFRLCDYLGLRLVTCVLTLVAVVAAIGCGGYDASKARLIMLAGALVACESLCDIFQAVVQRAERMHWIALSLATRGILGLALFVGLLWWTHSLAWAICGFCLAAFGTLLLIDVPVALACEPSSIDRPRRSQLSNLKSDMARLAWLSLPLGLATAALSLTTSIPRYWINGELGSTALGGFAVASSLMVAISLVVGALSQAACPRLARYNAAGDRSAFLRLLGRVSFQLALVMIASVAVMSIAGRPILKTLFGPAFASYAGLATVLMLAAGFRNYSILFGRAIGATRRFRTGLALRLLGIAILAALLPGWIAWLGLVGAAWAIALAWLLSSLFSLAALLHKPANPAKSDFA